jgi:nucleoside 2-deoxyribosyltransferase
MHPTKRFNNKGDREMKIYLAGPDVFRANAVEHGKQLKLVCADFGFEGLYPFDNEIPPTATKSLTAKLIYNANTKMIDDCDIVVANLDRFRGPSVDPGTAFEIGYAIACNKLVFGYYTKVPTSFYLDSKLVANGDPIYPNVEEFGLHDNLMIINSLSAAVFYSFKECIEELYYLNQHGGI